MTPAEKGERYARIFRKGGAFLAKGNIARALVVFKEGEALALKLGDQAMARRYAGEIARLRADDKSEK